MTDELPKWPFQKEDDQANAILIEWWHGLENNKGERAVMRRAASPAEAIFSPAYHRLLGRLQGQGYKVNREALAAIAGLVTHVKEHIGDNSLAKQMATPKSGNDSARVSGLRFRRLLAITEREELYPMLIRIIRFLDGRVNLASLANAVYWWNENTRKHWAFDYYSAAPGEK